MTFPYDNDDTTPVEHSEEEWQDKPTSEAAAFDALPLALTVRCGQLRLTLSELQRLNRGATVMVDNVLPGEALLCHGDFRWRKASWWMWKGGWGYKSPICCRAASTPEPRQVSDDGDAVA